MLLKASEPVPERPVVWLIYGEAGVGKTSLFNTSKNPALIDFDRGKDRAIFRKDTFVENSWQDVLNDEHLFKDYDTIGLDTAKACLDDFLMAYVINQDYNNKKNKLKAYGAIGDEFKLFLAKRQAEKADIIIIAHSKDEADGDVIRKIPDVTGQSYSLLLRKADQIGYMSIQNGKRTISFDPTDRTVGKNVAGLPPQVIPNYGEEGFETFLASLLQKTKEAITKASAEQLEAQKKSSEYQQKIASIKNAEGLTEIFNEINGLEPVLRKPLLSVIGGRAEAINVVWNRGTKSFEPKPKEIEEEKPEVPKEEKPISKNKKSKAA